MIGFFRRIRKKLADDNQFLKYSRYAVGEIVLVVIGILIALILNSNKELRTNRTQIEGMLKNISKNLENDMKSVNEAIKLIEKKHSLAENILAKKLSASDYEGDFYSNNYIQLTRGTMEVIRFESKAYERLMGNIEIIPEDYNPFVELLQHVYSVEVPISNDVETEIKGYLSEIEDELRTTYDWYSGTDSNHHHQQIDYYLSNPKYFNDVLRLKNHLTHLEGHLMQLKNTITIAYNNIHKELTPNAPFSGHIGKFEFTEPEELIEYLGKYKLVNMKSAPYVLDTLTLETKNNYLNIAPINIAVAKKAKDKFEDLVGGDVQFNFKRDEDGKIHSFEVTHKFQDKGAILTDVFEKIK